VNECASQGAQPAGKDIQALITSHDGVIDKAKVPLTIGTPWILNVLLLIFVPVKPNWDKFVYPAGNPMVHVSAVLAPVSVNVSSYSAPHVSVILIRLEQSANPLMKERHVSEMGKISPGIPLIKGRRREVTESIMIGF